MRPGEALVETGRAVAIASIILTVAPRLDIPQATSPVKIEQQQPPIPNPVISGAVLLSNREMTKPWILARRKSSSGIGRVVEQHIVAPLYNRRIGTQRFRLSV